MTKRPQHRFPATARAAFWFVLVMAPSWWVLLHGCEFETNPDKERDIWGQLHPSDDSDGGE